MVVANLSFIQPGLRSGLEAIIPFARIVRGLKKLLGRA